MNRRDKCDAMMRTTLTIEDDIAARIEELRRREGLSLKQVVNTLLREGLRSDQRPAARYRGAPHKLGLRAGYDPTRLNQLVDDLEADAWRERQERLRK